MAEQYVIFILMGFFIGWFCVPISKENKGYQTGEKMGKKWRRWLNDTEPKK